MTANKWGLIATILALIGLGFAAMSVNAPYLIPAWMPVLFFILAGLIAVALFINFLFPQLRFRQDKGVQRVVIFIGYILIVIGAIMVVSQIYSQKSKAATELKLDIPQLTTEQSATTTAPFKFPTFIDASQIDPNQKVNIVMGTNTFAYKWSDFQPSKAVMTPIMAGGTVPIMPHILGGQLYLDVSVYGGKDVTAIAIKDNVATVVPPNWDKNHDDYAYEVVNEKGTPVFQLIYVSQFTITVNGIFPFPGGLLLADNSGMVLNPSPFTTLNLDPIFKYPSSEHQRERANP